MSFEALESITEAESMAEATVAEAEAKARQMIAEAETAGKEAVKAAHEKAKSERADIFSQAEETISSQKSDEESACLNSLDALKASAQLKLDEAAKLIAERIVKD